MSDNDPDEGLDRIIDAFFKEGDEMEEDARIHAMLYPPRPWWKRALYSTFFACLLATGAGMGYRSADRVVETSRLEKTIEEAEYQRDTMLGELDAIRFQAGLIDEDGTLVSRLPMDSSDLEMLAGYCSRSSMVYPLQSSTRRIYQSVVEIDIQRRDGRPDSGSGVLLTENGYVVTAHHVMDDFVGGVARTHDGQEYRIMHPIIISSPRHDIAIIKVDMEGMARPVPYNRDFREPFAGMAVFTFGFYEGIPFNQMGRVTQSGYDARYNALFVEDTALTSVYIRGGFSGGAVVRADNGALAGITTYAIFHQTGSVGSPSGFVPLSHVREILRDYLTRQTEMSENSCF